MVWASLHVLTVIARYIYIETERARKTERERERERFCLLSVSAKQHKHASRCREHDSYMLIEVALHTWHKPRWVKRNDATAQTQTRRKPWTLVER